jgi:hypothetical protein
MRAGLRVSRVCDVMRLKGPSRIQSKSRGNAAFNAPPDVAGRPYCHADRRPEE